MKRQPVAALTEADLRLLVDPSTYRARGGNDVAAACYAAAFSLNVCAGARFTELLDLEAEDVDLGRMSFVRLGVRSSFGDVTAHRQRTVPLLPVCRMLLMRYEHLAGVPARGGMYFTLPQSGPLDEVKLAAAFDLFRREAAGGRLLKPDSLRLTFKYIMMRSGVSDDVYRYALGYSGRRVRMSGFMAERERRPEAVLEVLETDHPLSEYYLTQRDVA